MALQNKRVHFSEAPVMYTYSPPGTPRTPSPSWSDSSLPDNDSGPSTPPSASSFPPRALSSTFYDAPKQPVIASPIMFDARSQSTPLLWNVVAPLTHAAVRSGPKGKGKGKDVSALLPSDFSLPATNPGMSSLDVHVAQLPPFWKPIQLRRNISYGSAAPPVTVGEVLEAVHRYIQIPVSQKEFSMFPKDMQTIIAKAYWRRYDTAVRLGHAAEAEAIKKVGMRRVDALAGNTQFVAFVPMNNGGDVWQVILAAPRP